MLPATHTKIFSAAVLASSLFAALPQVQAQLTPINGSDVTATDNNTGYLFQTNNDLLVPDGVSIGDTNDISIDTTRAIPSGTVIFQGASLALGEIGDSNPILALNLAGATKTVNFVNSNLNAQSINFVSGSDANTQASFNDEVTIVGSIDNLTSSPGIGKINFFGAAQVIGPIGASNSLDQLILNSGNLDEPEIQFNASVNAEHIIVGTAQESTLVTFGNPQAVQPLLIDAKVTTNGVNNDLLTFQNNNQGITADGPIGSAANPFNQLVINDAVNFNSPAFSQSTVISAGQSLTLANDASLSSMVDGAGTNQGSLIFAGDAYVNQSIGNNQPLAAVQVNAGNVTVNAQNISTANLNINPLGTIILENSPTINGDINVAGNLSLVGNDMVTVNGSVNFAAGSTYTLDLSQASSGVGPIYGSGPILMLPSSLATPYFLNIDNANGVNLAFSGLPNNIVSIGTLEIPIAVAIGINLTDTAPIFINTAPLLKVSTDIEVCVVNINPLRFKIVLDVETVPLITVVDQSNSVGVAGALDTIFADPNINADFGQLAATIYALPVAQDFNRLLAQLAPPVSGSVFQTIDTQNDIVFGAIGDQLDTVSLRQNFEGCPRANGYAGGDWFSAKGVWAKVLGQHSRQKERDSISGYRNNVYGLAIGSDRTWDKTTLGLALSWAKAHVDEALMTGSRVKTDSYQATLYGQYDFGEPLYFNWFGSVGYNDNHQDRRVNLLGFDATSSSKYKGWQYGAKAEFGYDIDKGAYHLIPLASLAYTNLYNRSYTEKSGSYAFTNLAVQANHYQNLKGGLGVKVAIAEHFRAMTIQPEVHALVYYDFMRDKVENTAEFVDTGVSFVTTGVKNKRDSYDLGLSLTAFDNSGWVMSASYDLGLKRRYVSSTGYLKLRYEWK